MRVLAQTSQQAPASLLDPAQLPPVGQVSVLVPLRDKCFLPDLSPDRTPASPQGVLSQHSHFPLPRSPLGHQGLRSFFEQIPIWEQRPDGSWGLGHVITATRSGFCSCLGCSGLSQSPAYSPVLQETGRCFVKMTDIVTISDCSKW